jgi:hypothetical protein
VLVKEADGDEMVVYETPSTAAADQDTWPDELLAAIREYNPATDVLFLMEPEGAGTLLGMRETPPCLTHSTPSSVTVCAWVSVARRVVPTLPPPRQRRAGTRNRSRCGVSRPACRG